MEETLGVPVRAVMWRQDGHWRLSLRGPQWLIDDLADELVNRAVFRMTSWGGRFDTPEDREILFDQLPMSFAASPTEDT